MLYFIFSLLLWFVNAYVFCELPKFKINPYIGIIYIILFNPIIFYFELLILGLILERNNII